MCDSLAIVEAGRVFFAKNSDRDPNEGQGLEWHPRRNYGADEHLRCTWISIPQAPETYAVLLSRPFWMWGAEMGTNEYGVTIGNEAVFTKEALAPTGLTGMDLLRLGLERSRTARAACDTIIRLLETHGQGGGCGHEHRAFTYHNSFIVADPRQAFVLETAGRHWAVEEIHGARSISNGLTIPEFAVRHSDWLKTHVSACRVRQPRTQALAGAAGSLTDLFALLREHGDGQVQPSYSWINGGMNAPCMHAGGLLANSQTTGSWAVELSAPDATHWVTATSSPCLSVFKPVQVDAPMALPMPGEQFDDTLWWRHERLQRRIMGAPPSIAEPIRQACAALEEQWLSLPPQPAVAFAAHSDLVDSWWESLGNATTEDSRPWWTRRYWSRESRRAGL
jgi:hypothetical protein